MRAFTVLAASLPTLALSAPADLNNEGALPVTCTKPEKPDISFLRPSIPDVADCIEAVKQLKATDTYTSGSTVSFKTCTIVYSSTDDIDGDELSEAAKDAVVAIIGSCKYHQGTYSASGPEISVKKPEVKKDD